MQPPDNSNDFAVVFDELNGMSRGRRGVIFKARKYFLRKQFDRTILFECSASSGNRKCKGSITTTLAPELKVTDESCHTISCCLPEPSKRKTDMNGQRDAKRFSMLYGNMVI